MWALQGLICLICGIALNLSGADRVYASIAYSAIDDTATLKFSQALRTEEAALSSFKLGVPSLDLTPSNRELRIPFSIAPNARTGDIDLFMVAQPHTFQSSGRIEVFVNRSRAVEFQPKADHFEARFALNSDTLKAGENVLVIRLIGQTPSGWSINSAASRLRVSVAPAKGYSSLSEIEEALASDFAAPRRVFINAGSAGEDNLAISALIAQGLALRMEEAPIIVLDKTVAELTINTERREGATMPAIDLTSPSEIRLSAGDQGTLIAAARLFATRKMDHHALRFDMTSAMTAARLGQDVIKADQSATLQALSRHGAPFGTHQGGRTAIVFTSHDPQERAASLSLIARAALASGYAWLYAWYGDSTENAPKNHHLMVLGPQQFLDPHLMAIAPVETRTAANAAANRAPRVRSFYGSTAYASNSDERAALITGFAALFEDGDGRQIALITAPEGADFARAAKRLARSNSLWESLEGRAVVWGASSVTSFGPSSAPQFSTQWASLIIRMNDGWLSLSAILLGLGLFLIGRFVNRTSRRIE